MQIIDETGRFLKIINIIDLGILIFLTLLVVGVFHLHTRGDLLRDFDPQKREFIQKNITLSIENLNDITLSNIKQVQEDATLAPEGFRIVNVYSLLLTNRSCIRNESLYNVKLLAEVDTHLDKENKLHYYKGTPLLAGSILRIKLVAEEIKTEILGIR